MTDKKKDTDALAEKSKADYVVTVDTFAKGFVIRALDASGPTSLPVVNRVVDLEALSEVIRQLIIEF